MNLFHAPILSSLSMTCSSMHCSYLSGRQASAASTCAPLILPMRQLTLCWPFSLLAKPQATQKVNEAGGRSNSSISVVHLSSVFTVAFVIQEAPYLAEGPLEYYPGGPSHYTPHLTHHVPPPPHYGPVPHNQGPFPSYQDLPPPHYGPVPHNQGSLPTHQGFLLPYSSYRHNQDGVFQNGGVVPDVPYLQQPLRIQTNVHHWRRSDSVVQSLCCTPMQGSTPQLTSNLNLS
ncbi:hypothetical protein E2C01_028572 [Portunus trituberculatus]|uniref:Uncharacterized protein n=1 Tax=Portunus trituberculatus TaxID=210409 RepID=A0A5B7ES19_PORTR|nr:hypothetical protein [Portunus trituberculatus]